MDLPAHKSSSLAAVLPSKAPHQSSFGYAMVLLALCISLFGHQRDAPPPSKEGLFFGSHHFH
ncbi:hypothetical protein EYF80_062817 [Liparis tanakae]|uniref:Uncharacterized protein n=1 Tax=Liparis tanakae TaxID=230148 RepID=A0A4Z2EE69_9TELE|nr:hypothetical protein EYF80_062817 [Liparis tanakae]